MCHIRYINKIVYFTYVAYNIPKHLIFIIFEISETFFRAMWSEKGMKGKNE